MRKLNFLPKTNKNELIKRKKQWLQSIFVILLVANLSVVIIFLKSYKRLGDEYKRLTSISKSSIQQLTSQNVKDENISPLIAFNFLKSNITIEKIIEASIKDSNIKCTISVKNKGEYISIMELLNSYKSIRLMSATGIEDRKNQLTFTFEAEVVSY